MQHATCPVQTGLVLQGILLVSFPQLHSMAMSLKVTRGTVVSTYSVKWDLDLAKKLFTAARADLVQSDLQLLMDITHCTVERDNILPILHPIIL